MRFLVLILAVSLVALVGCGGDVVIPDKMEVELQIVECLPCPTVQPCPECKEEHYHRAWLLGMSRMITLKEGGNTTYKWINNTLTEEVIYPCKWGQKFDETLYTFGNKQYYFICE